MRVLAVGAHPDDVELGCGGALLSHARHGDEVALLVMTEGERGPQQFQPRRSEQVNAAFRLGATLYWGGFPDGGIPDGAESVGAVEEVVQSFDPEVVYTHFPTDSHQDHRHTATAVTAACRRVQRLLHFESPTSLGFAPAVFVDISDVMHTKLELVREHFSQVIHSGMVDLEALEGLARYRGFQARIERGHAEGFAIGRFVWDLAVPGPSAFDLAIGTALVAPSPGLGEGGANDDSRGPSEQADRFGGEGLGGLGA
jgi:LmbE family N-acetylglucosaminyl deacetylase